MKYQVRVSAMSYGDIIVEANSKEEAKAIAEKSYISYFEHELTDVTVEKYVAPSAPASNLPAIPSLVAHNLPDGRKVEKFAVGKTLNRSDYTSVEWNAICRIFEKPADSTQTIRLNAAEFETITAPAESPAIPQETTPTETPEVRNITNHTPGYRKDTFKEPLILEPEDWTQSEWNTLCKLTGLPPHMTERIVLSNVTMERYLSQKSEAKNFKEEIVPHGILRVETPMGALIATAGGDPEYPGIWIELRRPDVSYDLALALVEYTKTEADLPKNGFVISRIFGNALIDDYTDRVIHENIEEFFKIEDNEK